MEDKKEEIQERIRQEVRRLAEKKWKSMKTSVTMKPLPASHTLEKTKTTSKPHDDFPDGLSDDEFKHLMRCRHQSVSKEVEQEYRVRYEELRDHELDGCPTPLKSVRVVYAVVNRITRAKTMCGILAARQTYSIFRQMMVNFMKHLDSIAKCLYENISSVSCALYPEIGTELLEVLKELEQKFSQRLILTQSSAALTEFIMQHKDSDDTKRTIVSLHRILILLKMDCMHELVAFSHETEERPLVFYPKQMIRDAEIKLRNALHAKEQKKHKHKQVVARVNGRIAEWSDEVVRKLTEEQNRRSLEKLKLQEIPSSSRDSGRGRVSAEKKSEPVPSSSRTRDSCGHKTGSSKKESKFQARDSRALAVVGCGIDDSDSDQSEDRMRGKTHPPVQTLTELRQKASRMMSAMQQQMDKLNERRQGLQKYCEATDEILKEKKCPLLFYKEYQKYRL